MKKILIAAFTAISMGVQAQEPTTADAVIEKYLTAIGGRENIAKIQDLTISSTTETQMGTSETEVKYKFPDKYSTSTYANGMELMSAIYDGTKFKRSGRMMGMGGGGGRGGSNGGGGNANPQEPIDGKAAQLMAARQNIFTELYYDKVGITRNLVGKEKVNDKDAYKIELATPDGRKWADFYDVESGLKVKTWSENETPRGKFESSIYYKDYKKFKGMDVMLPSKNTRTAGQMGEITTEVQAVKMNKGLKDSEFIIKE